MYPILLQLTGRHCIVVGGGPVAERKVQGLLAASARVTVISPQVVPGLAELAAAGQIQHIVLRPFAPADIVPGVTLVFAATNHPSVNAEVAAAARAVGAWVNVASDRSVSDFYNPATRQAGPIMVSVSTNGQQPQLAVELVERFITSITPTDLEQASTGRKTRGTTR